MSYTELFMDWLASASVAIIYNVVIAFLLITLGIALGFLVKRIFVGLLRKARFDDFVGKLHVSELFGKLRVSELFGEIIEIAIIITFTIQAFNVLGWELIANALSSLLYWIPGVVSALFIFMVFYAVGRWVQIRMDESQGVAHRLAPVAMGIIVFFGGIMALNQIGVDTALIEQATLIIIFGFALAFALAVGIAVGFGLKDDVHDLFRRFFGSPKPQKRSSKKRR